MRWRIVQIVATGCAMRYALVAAQCPNGSPPPCGAVASRPPAPNSLAVLFFAARDSTDAYLADGLTEDITSLLSSVAAVQVKAPGVARRAQSVAPGNVPAIARALGVRYILDGSVRRIGMRVRISVQLLSGSTAIATWGDVFDRTPEELLTLPSVIALQVTSRVAGPVRTEAGSTLGTLRTRSPAAYDHYLRGNFYLAQRSPGGTARALEEYREAEQLDSGFAAAIGRAAYAHALARSNYYPLSGIPIYPLSGIPIDSLAIRGLAVADRALRRDSASSDAWMARAFLLAFINPHDLTASVETFQRAIALDPKNAEAHHQYAQVLEYLGRHDDADRELRIALALDPGRAISYADLAKVHVRDTMLAVGLADTAVALDPTSAYQRRLRAMIRSMAGDVHGAVEDAELANRLQPGNIVVENVLALVLARAGDSTRARTLISHWRGRTDHWSVFAALVAVGDTAAALDRMAEASPDPLYWSVFHWPLFDALRGNERFERLLTELRPLPAVGP